MSYSTSKNLRSKFSVEPIPSLTDLPIVDALNMLSFDAGGQSFNVGGFMHLELTGFFSQINVSGGFTIVDLSSTDTGLAILGNSIDVHGGYTAIISDSPYTLNRLTVHQDAIFTELSFDGAVTGVLSGRIFNAQFGAGEDDIRILSEFAVRGLIDTGSDADIVRVSQGFECIHLGSGDDEFVARMQGPSNVWVDSVPNVVIGGEGADKFDFGSVWFASAEITIEDFNASEDTFRFLVLDAEGGIDAADTLADFQVVETATGIDLIIDTDFTRWDFSELTIHLSGVNLEDLHDDILFGF